MFHKPRPVAYAQKPKVEEALRKIENDGVIVIVIVKVKVIVIVKVNSVPCAAPILVVGRIGTWDFRICGNFSVIYNKCTDVETYPLPKIEDIYDAIRG